MSLRLVVRRLGRPQIRSACQPCSNRAFTQRTLINTSSRPNIPFLSNPSVNSSRRIRGITTETKDWIRREFRTAIKYTLVLWAAGGSILLIFFAVSEETAEREYPTPHEWTFGTRKLLRDTHKWMNPKTGLKRWGNAIQSGAQSVRRLQNPSKDGEGVIKLDHYEVEHDDMIAYDISAKSEEWKRGYFEALMATAKAAEHTEGWLLDVTRNLNVPPEYVIGPSNPRPKPKPPGAPPAPREEDCVIAFPPAADFYLKISRTIGFSPKQQLDAKLEEAAYWEYMGRPDTAKECLAQCLILANGDAKATAIEDWIRLDSMTPVRRLEGTPPSANTLEVMTSIANMWARTGDLSHALTAYLSLLHARRSLSTSPPPSTRDPPRARISTYQKLVDIVSPPPYPSPPPSGFETPWRSTEERCREAALQMHIGEILFATASRDEGLAWTRDGVDEVEEQMRALGPPTIENRLEPVERRTCRECLSMGLANWTTMVAKMAKEERKKLEEKDTKGSNGAWGLAFWRGSAGAEEGRWMAEEKVVAERVRRTSELVDDIAAPKDNSLMAFFKA